MVKFFIYQYKEHSLRVSKISVIKSVISEYETVF